MTMQPTTINHARAKLEHRSHSSQKGYAMNQFTRSLIVMSGIALASVLGACGQVPQEVVAPLEQAVQAKPEASSQPSFKTARPNPNSTGQLERQHEPRLQHAQQHRHEPARASENPSTGLGGHADRSGGQRSGQSAFGHQRDADLEAGRLRRRRWLLRRALHASRWQPLQIRGSHDQQKLEFIHRDRTDGGQKLLVRDSHVHTQAYRSAIRPLE